LGVVIGVRNLIRRADKHFYFVTNHHIWETFQGRALAVRLNSYKASHVVPIPSGDFQVWKELDLAIAPLPPVEDLPFVYVMQEQLVTQADLQRLRIGLGSDVFMIYNVGATQRNICGLRFGNISVLPYDGEPFYRVEMRSVPGHSGSPVCVYETPNIFGNPTDKDKQFAPLLLGLNRGHEAIYERVGRINKGQFQQLTDMVSENNTAIASVVPAWNIRDALQNERFVEQRFKVEAEMGPVPLFAPDFPKPPKGKKLVLKGDGTWHFEKITPEDRKKTKELRKQSESKQRSASQKLEREP